MDISARRWMRLSTGLAAAAVIAMAGALRAQSGATATPPQQQGQPQQPAPVFKAATNFIQVDVYPTKDGKIVEGLTAKDFQILEDGKPQALEGFEFFRIEPNTPEAQRHDPNTQEEGNRLAADPRNRVFVLFLDHYQASLSGSHAITQPVVSFLNRLLAPGDLFGVATALMLPKDLVLGRQTETIEDQLTRNWTWGLQSGANALDQEEEWLVRCYGENPALAITQRLREERTLESLTAYVRHLGALREARKALVVLGIGWQLYTKDPGQLNAILTPDHYASKPRIGITDQGKISMDPPANPGMVNWTWCAQQADHAFNLDNQRRYRDLIDEANRNNVAFYPVNVNGLSSGDRAESMRTLAENTDGIISNTNDFNLALRRISDDVSAYYLLGYSSTNTKQDGSYRKIDVKVLTPGLRVKARRGYFAPGGETRSLGPAANPKAAMVAGGTEALGVLSRLRASAELYTYGVTAGDKLSVVVEVPGSDVAGAAWDRGATIQATLMGAPADAAPLTAKIEPGQRSVLFSIPKPAGAGPYRVNIKATGGPGTVVNDRVEIADAPASAAPIGEPLLYRATPSAQSVPRPVASYLYWRTERVHIEWPTKAALDQRVARLLGRDGRPLAVPVNLTERDQAGQPTLVADLNLAPLAAGDYVIELVAGAGATEVRRYIPIRVLR